MIGFIISAAVGLTLFLPFAVNLVYFSLYTARERLYEFWSEHVRLIHNSTVYSFNTNTFSCNCEFHKQKNYWKLINYLNISQYSGNQADMHVRLTIGSIFWPIGIPIILGMSSWKFGKSLAIHTIDSVMNIKEHKPIDQYQIAGQNEVQKIIESGSSS